MNPNKILGSQDKKNIIEELLKKAKEDDLIKRALRGDFRKTELLEDIPMPKPGDITGLEEIELDTRGLPKIHKTLAFNPDGDRVLMTTFDNKIDVCLFAREKPKECFIYYVNRLYSSLVNAAFSPDGNYIATISDANILRILGFDKGNLDSAGAFKDITSINLPYPANAVAIHPDNRHIAVGLKKLLVMYEFNGKIIEKIHRQNWESDILDIAFDPKGRYIALASKVKKDYSATTHKIDSDIIVETRPSHFVMSVPSLFSVDFSPDGEYLAIGCEDAIEIDGFKGNDLKFVAEQGDTGDIYSVSFDPKGEYLLASTSNGDAKLFKILRAGRK